MSSLQPKCKALGCSATNRLYFCCNIDSPRCIGCQQPCKKCGKQRRKLVKSERAVSQIGRQCRNCHSKTSKQWTNFSCGHYFCTKCVSKSLCALIKQNFSNNRLNHDYQSISCSCKKSIPATITMYLQKYCFCCGENLQQSLYLNFSLKINISCKKRLQYSSSSFNQGKTFLQEEVFKQLIPKCKKCSQKIDQLKVSKDDKKLTYLCQSCSIVQKEPVKILIQHIKGNTINSPYKQANIIQKEKQNGYTDNSYEKEQVANMKMEKLPCNSCDRKLDIKDLMPQLFICYSCHRIQNQNILININKQSNNKVIPQSDSSQKKQNREVLVNSPLGFLYQKCIKCSEQRRIAQLLYQQQKKIYICVKCSKDQTKPNKVQKYDLQKSIKEEKKKEDQQRQFDKYQSNHKAKIQSSSAKKSQRQVCFVCNIQIFDWQKKIESRELGGSICPICYSKNENFYSYKQSSKLSKSTYEKKNYVEDKFYFSRNKSERGQQRYVPKRIVDPFSKNIVIKQEKTNPIRVQRRYEPSIIQPQLQQIILVPSINDQTLISCFNCGYFIEERCCRQLPRANKQKVLVCPTCLYSLKE